MMHTAGSERTAPSRRGILRRRLGTVLACLLLPGVARAQTARWWVYCDSREAADGRPPTLVVRGANGRELELEPVADAPLISYLGDRAFGAMARLSIGLADQNRALLRFALPKRMQRIASARLRLGVHMSKMPPSGHVELQLHAVEQRWNEATASWRRQPKWRARPFATVAVPPRDATVECDATALVKEWASGAHGNFGVLVKMATPIGEDLPRRLAGTVPWLPNTTAALARALRERRPILACVRPAYTAAAPDEGEQLLLATAFADPAVIALVTRRFVPLRIGCIPTNYTHGRLRGADPLRPLGADATKIKPPALVVSGPDGTLLATLEGIGTYDAGVVDDFLRRVLRDAASPAVASQDAEELLAAGALDAAARRFARLAPRPRDYGRCRIAMRRGRFVEARALAIALAAGDDAVARDAHVAAGLCDMRLGMFGSAVRALTAALERKPRRDAEATYWLGCLQRRTGDESAARRSFARVRAAHVDSPWALKSTVRLAWSDRIDPAEPLRAIARPAFARPESARPASAGAPATRSAASVRTEVRGARDLARVVPQALRYLVEQQRPDGSWPSQSAMYRSAITALCAKAADTWIPSVESDDLRRRLDAAATRADAWLERHMLRMDAKKANSFGAAYMLDYLLYRHHRTKDARVRKLAQRAVRFLEDGQCPNGAWSYSHQFGTGWRGGFGGWPRTTKGRVHSVNTGPALVYLAAAKSLGFDVDKKRLARGADVLAEMRESAGTYTYTFPVPKSFARSDQSIARGPVCEQALVVAGESTKRDLRDALRLFLKHCDALRKPTKIDKSWASPNNYSSYFYFYAHYHAVLAARHLGGPVGRLVLAKVRAEVLSCGEIDGTWVDFPEVGKPYGTAMALLILALTEGPR